MGVSESRIRVTNDYLADEIMQAGRQLIELSMRLREGFEVDVQYVHKSVADDSGDD